LLEKPDFPGDCFAATNAARNDGKFKGFYGVGVSVGTGVSVSVGVSVKLRVGV
jgi:hypothetical protein